MSAPNRLDQLCAAIAELNPISFLIDGMRWLILDGWDMSTLLPCIAVATAIVFAATTVLHSYQTFWLRGRFKDLDHGEDTDVWAVNNGYSSVVPVQFDMTAHHAIAELNTWDHAW